MSTGLFVLIAAIILAVFFVGGFYNSFVSTRNMSEQAFSTIDVLLKKRSDLIPNLVATIQQYMEHESTILIRISELRSCMADRRGDTSARVAADNEFNRLLSGLMVQVENYPDLKANNNFFQMQTLLENLEEQLSAARRTYNAAVTRYNTSTEMFPGNLVAMIFSFRRKALLDTPAAERVVPNVKELFRK